MTPGTVRPYPIFFVRHGQTDWNAEHRLQGQADTDINALGRAQADANGETLRQFLPAIASYDFVSSPMRRTRETMERIRSRLGLDPVGYRTDERLKEIHFGDWQGFTYADLERREPGISARRRADKWRFVPPGEGAENYVMLGARIAPWLAEVAGPTVCVTHGGVIRTLFLALGGYTETQAASLDVPQDRVLRFENGALAWV